MTPPALEPATPGPSSEIHRPTIALLVGNPNVGKSSLFNALTGARVRVGNYPGITVERRSGTVAFPAGKGSYELVDIPGTYSLAARSSEEQIALSAILESSEATRVVIAVVDAGQLSRCLYLVAQLIELRVPLVIALNMVDEAGDASPDPALLSQLLGVPVVVTDGRSGQGTAELTREIERLARGATQRPLFHVRYDESLLHDVDAVADALPAEQRGSVERNRALALWALTSLEDHDELAAIDPALRARVEQVRAAGRDFDLEVVTTRYRAIDELVARLALGDNQARARAIDRVDRVALHPVWGVLTFLLTMGFIFQALFSWADPAIGVIEDLVGFLQTSLGDALPPGVLTDLLVDGVVGGVGNVIVFLPQILLLFLFVGLLEDSGYMARVAYLMDRIMRSLGLHGRAFVPMLSGFACAVPAILATRTLERRRDRLLTMMVVPLMTCSARLPVYTLVIGALFPVGESGWLPVQGLLLGGMYVFSLVISLLAAWVLGRTAIRGRSVPLLLELPPYRWPRLRPTLLMMREKSGQFLQEAGGVILVATVVLWALLYFPRDLSDTSTKLDSPVAVIHGEESESSAPTAAATATPESEPEPEATRLLENSYGGRLGRALEPVMAPLGFDWKITTGIIGAFAAREVFVSTMAVVYGVGEVDDEALPLRERIRSERHADGSPVYSPLTGFSLLVFFALACQCMSTLAVVRRETGGYGWPTFLFVYMTGLAYVCSLLIFQGGRLLGF